MRIDGSVRQLVANLGAKSGGVLSLISLLAITIVDLHSGSELSFAVFYLIPVSLAAWYCGLAPGLIVAVISTVGLETVLRNEGLRYSTLWIDLWNPTARFIFYFFVVYLLVRQRKSLELLQQLASTDPLTCLANRRTLTLRLESEIARQNRTRRPLSLAFIDIDHFKILNDSRGHGAGDHALQRVAAVLRSGLRTSDLSARLGGDEFGLLLPETDGTQASVLLTRLHETLSRDMRERSWPLTFSVGVVHGISSMSSEAWIRAADNLMYDVKRRGRNAINLSEVPSTPSE